MADDGIIYCEFKNGNADDYERVFLNAGKELENCAGMKKLVFNLENVFLSNGFLKTMRDFHEDYDGKIEYSSVFGAGSGLRRLILETSGCAFYIAGDREEAFDRLQTDAEELI